MSDPPSTVDFTAAIQRVTGHTGPPPPDRRTPSERARDEHLETVAEDRAYEARWGGTDEDADRAADAYERWLDDCWGDAR